MQDKVDKGDFSVFIRRNIPDLVNMYGTEAIYLPLAPLVIKIKSDGAVKALDDCGLTERIIVQEPVTNTLFIASLMCDKMCNEHAPLKAQRHPLQELEKCVGADRRFNWVVLQKGHSHWGVEWTADAVTIPKVNK